MYMWGWVGGGRGRTWRTFAHEVGHHFKRDRSFEDGQYKTCGIMDYGDGKLNGQYQFNTKYRNAQICASIQKVVGWCEVFARYGSVIRLPGSAESDFKKRGKKQPPSPRRGRKEPPKGLPSPASCAAPGPQGAAKKDPFSSLLRRAGAARSRQKGSLFQPPAPRRGRQEPPKGIPFPASGETPRR